MSMKDEQKEILEEEVVVEEEATELVDWEKEAKKAKVIAIAKKVGKVAGVVAVGVIGFLIGSAVKSNSQNDDSDIIEVELETEQTEA